MQLVLYDDIPKGIQEYTLHLIRDPLDLKVYSLKDIGRSGNGCSTSTNAKGSATTSPARSTQGKSPPNRLGFRGSGFEHQTLFENTRTPAEAGRGLHMGFRIPLCCFVNPVLGGSGNLVSSYS